MSLHYDIFKHIYRSQLNMHSGALSNLPATVCSTHRMQNQEPNRLKVCYFYMKEMKGRDVLSWFLPWGVCFMYYTFWLQLPRHGPVSTQGRYATWRDIV